ncbi:MAG: DUF1273 family protein [Clostridia bacterium]|nr:DUF1273 family protein [Clostridia bacterium]
MQDLLETKKENLSCAFTGHRELGEDFSQKSLKKQIKHLIEQGVKTFYDGGAIGFDLIAAETVLKFRKRYGLKLILCVPFYGQESRFPARDKTRYQAIYKKADEVVIVSEHYYRACFLKRNDYMIDRADYMIAYLNKEVGGTAYTVKKFRAKKGENVFFV